MRPQIVRWGTAIALTATLVGGTALPAAAATRSHLLQSAADDLTGIGVTGVQGLTRVNGLTTTARSGYADVDRKTPVPANGSFRMGSDTKPFVSVVLLQLVGEGRISLDDTVEHWLPGVVSGNGNDGRTITVRNLLQHTSGLVDYLGDVPSVTSGAGYEAHKFDHYSEAALVALAMQHAPEFAAGTHWSYSNTNYVLAGMIIQKVTGHTWAQQVEQRIIRPLALSHTYYPGDQPFLTAPHAEHYQQWGPGDTLHDVTAFNMTAADAAGSLVSTTADLARFWQALQGGRLLRPAQMRQMHSTVLAEAFQDILPGARYGLGIMYIPDSCGGYWSHWGDTPGSSTLNAVSADARRVTVLSVTTQFADERQGAVRARELEFLDDAMCDPA